MCQMVHSIIHHRIPSPKSQNDILHTRDSELVYNNVNPEWGSQITGSLIEHEKIESSRSKISYSSVTKVL